jgi:hypothetical protein
VSTTGLEVVESLEAVEIGLGLGRALKGNLDTVLVFRVVGDELVVSTELFRLTHPLDQEHANEVVGLVRLVHGDTRETRDEDVRKIVSLSRISSADKVKQSWIGVMIWSTRRSLSDKTPLRMTICRVR